MIQLEWSYALGYLILEGLFRCGLADCSCIHLQVGEEVERALAKYAPPKVGGVRYADKALTLSILAIHCVYFLERDLIACKC